MLARRDGETLNALLKRLDRALGRYYDDGTVVDKVNDGERRCQYGMPGSLG